MGREARETQTQLRDLPLQLCAHRNQKPALHSPLGARLDSRRELGRDKLLVKAGRGTGMRRGVGVGVGARDAGTGDGLRKAPWTRPLAA